MRTYLLFIILLLLITASCKREWDNPYDLECPNENFAPQNFKATQVGDSIVLKWEQSNDKITGFLIEKSRNGGPYIAFAEINKKTKTKADGKIESGANYKYRISSFAANRESTKISTEITPLIPLIFTSFATNISPIYAKVGGNITGDGASSVSEIGICYNTNPNPTINNYKTPLRSDDGNFNIQIAALSSNTTYYVRSYASINQGLIYGNEVTFKTYNFETVNDIDNNVYNTVTIGSQVWMVENLKTTKYNDGTPIPNVTDSTQWKNLTTGAYCNYENSEDYATIYGRLYNWHAVNTGKLCPSGWHVPTDTEWIILITYLEGESFAGGRMKEPGMTHWESPNTGATNTASFTALAGGYRDYYGKFFDGIGYYSFWWSYSEYDTFNAWRLSVQYDSMSIINKGTSKSYGFSVRCLKD